MSVVQDLRVAARRWLETRSAPSASKTGEREREELRAWFRNFRQGRGGSAVKDASLFEIDASQLPWLDTGIDLDAGDWVSTLAAGRVVLSAALDIWVGPQFQLWARVGEAGRIFNGSRDTNTFTTPVGGRLYLASYFPGQWGDPAGRISTSLTDYAKFSGGISVAVLRWKGEAASALAGVAASVEGGDPRLASELSRIREEVLPPAGWEYLWFLGRSEIFREISDDGHACIACCTERNAGILQHEAAFDLGAETRLRWSWKVEELPSVLPENTALSHDYLSVAVEFENGRDITYTWSQELAEGTGYWCPLPTWKDREFHVVVRSGAPGLGAWLAEDRNLAADYRRYIGEPPRRVVKVWLIAVSLFQRRRGAALFRDFVLEDVRSGRRLEIR